MTTSAATIGASVVEHVDGDEQRSPAVASHRSPLAVSPSRLQTPPSLLVSALHHRLSSQKPILLQGPPRSGRSSLLMDLACATAAATPCRCHLQPCRCFAVAIILGSNNMNSFPLSCQKVTNNNNNKLSGMVFPSSSNNNNTNTTWNPAILRRIQVHHIAHVRDVMEYLLTIQGKTAAEQPWGGIFLDDLDVLCGLNEGMLMSQVGKLQYT